MDAVIFSDCANNSFSNIVYRYLGPYKVAHSIRKGGYTAQVIDHVLSMSYDELMGFCNKFIDNDTKFIGISATFLCMFPHMHSDGVGRRIPEVLFKCLVELKKMYPKAKFVIGGNTAEHTGAYDIFNCSVEGDGEDISRELMDFYAGVGEEPIFRREIPRWGKGFIKVYHQARQKRYDIETDDFRFTKQDGIIHGETLPIEISRGCIFKCKFCQYDKIGRGKLDYLRSMDLIREEMMHNYENWGITRYHILCDTFNDTTIKLDMFEKMVQTLPFKIQFRCYIRADLIHRFPETALQLQEVGMIGAYHGIETFHPEASKIIGKGWSGKHARDYLPKLYHDVWGGKVIQHLSFIAGLPHDNYQNIVSTVNWFKSNHMHSGVFQALFLARDTYRNQSEFERDYAKYGYRFDETSEDPSRYWVSDQWSYKDIQKFLEQISRQMNRVSKLPDQEALNWMGAGMSLEEVTTLRGNFNKQKAMLLRSEFIEKYKQNLRDI